MNRTNNSKDAPKWLEPGGEISYPITLPNAPIGFDMQYVNTVWDNFTGQGAAPYLFFVGHEGERTAGEPFKGHIRFREAFEVGSPHNLNWREAYRYVGNPLAEWKAGK